MDSASIPPAATAAEKSGGPLDGPAEATRPDPTLRQPEAGPLAVEGGRVVENGPFLENDPVLDTETAVEGELALENDLSAALEAVPTSQSLWRRPVTAWMSPPFLKVALAFSVCMVALALMVPLPTFDRTILGLAWLAPTVWIPRQLERIARRAEENRWARSRRYHRLRSLVVLFIEEVKRLNWLSVDARKGLRDQGKAREDLDRIEENLHDLIAEMRQAAGVADRTS